MISNRFAKVIAVGNGLSLIIPATVCRDLEIYRGQFFQLSVVDENTLVFRRAKVVDQGQVGDTVDISLPKIDYGE